MASPNRAALLTKAHKVLKKHYKPVALVERPLLEQLIFAACLENADYDDATKAFEALRGGFFDWNEVRVSTSRELAEVMPMLPDPQASAANVKRTLYSVFESTYSFDLESLKKQNIGQAIQRLKKVEGTTPFMVAFATQSALGGHSVPVDRGTLDALAVLGIVEERAKEDAGVQGMERAIPKSKGIEFGSLLHQLGADMVANPYSPSLHKILLEINPDAKDRLPKRPSKTAAKPTATSEPAAKEGRPGKPAPRRDEKEKATSKPPEAKPRPAPEKAEKKKLLPERSEKKHEPEKRTATSKKAEADHEKKAPAKKKGAISIAKRKPR